MLIYTNAIDYPDVTFELSNIEFIDDSVNVIGNLTFNNVTKEINSLALIDQTDKFAVNGSLSIKLSDFKVQRPSLMFVPIDDLIKIDYYIELNWWKWMLKVHYSIYVPLSKLNVILYSK